MNVFNSMPGEIIFQIGSRRRTEFWLAHKLRPQKVEDFATIKELRDDLIGALFDLYQETRQRGIITEFSKESFDPQNSFARIGTGSVGGKARGLGFVNTLINNYNLRDRFEGVEISVPSAVVIATDVFDRFFRENRLDKIVLKPRTMKNSFSGLSMRHIFRLI